MVKIKVVEVDVKTGKTKIVEGNVTLPKPIEEPKPINLKELAKLLEYAKKQGWI